MKFLKQNWLEPQIKKIILFNLMQQIHIKEIFENTMKIELA